MAVEFGQTFDGFVPSGACECTMPVTSKVTQRARDD
jgi:hypothetical protein